MKTEFMVAITQLSAEKNLSVELVLAAVESALISAYRKNTFTPDQDISVKINSGTGGVKVFVKKTVVDKVATPTHEISLAEAKKIDKNIKVADLISIEATPPDAGRIAIQTARQIILQRLHEAEHHAIFEEFTCREGEVLSGTIQRVTPDQIYVDLGKAEAVLPEAEQVHNERYRVGQRLKFYLVEVIKSTRGPQIIVSRSHRNLLKRLFELEVPEIHSGAVEIKSVAREAGHRSKVAVAARQEGIDPVGCCVGLRGIRIQNIVNELNDEKIDVVQWADDPKAYIANALSPAQVSNVRLNTADSTALVVVPDKQLSLAIGKEGQNARLAAKLTGWRIDIKSVSSVENEKALIKEVAAKEKAVKAEKVVAAVSGEAAPAAEEEAKVVSEVEEAVEVEEQVEEDEEEEEEEEEKPLLTDYEIGLTSGKIKEERPTQIRFAEDILPSRSGAAKQKRKELDLREKSIKLKKAKPKRKTYEEDDEAI